MKVKNKLFSLDELSAIIGIQPNSMDLKEFVAFNKKATLINSRRFCIGKEEIARRSTFIFDNKAYTSFFSVTKNPRIIEVKRVYPFVPRERGASILYFVGPDNREFRDNVIDFIINTNRILHKEYFVRFYISKKGKLCFTTNPRKITPHIFFETDSYNTDIVKVLDESDAREDILKNLLEWKF